jgi:hypothetical protein
MKIHKVKESIDSTLYELSEPAHNFVSCVDYDDDEVNKANVMDVRECVDIVYNYLKVKQVNDKRVFYPADNKGHGLSSPILIADINTPLEKCFAVMYGNMVVLEDKLIAPKFDDFDFNPDHAI